MKLSIIIPVYNVEKYLAECLKSVLFYDNTDYDVIAVDDGSTDSSYKILEKYAHDFPNKLKVIRKNNGGLGSARNSGLACSNSEYVVFLDSDDFYSPNAVSEMLDICSEAFDICFFDFISITEDGKFIKNLPGGKNPNSYFNLESRPEILFELPSGTNKIFRRKIFEETSVYFPDRAWFEDLRTTPKLYIYAKKMLYVDKQWYNYRQQSQSITHGSSPDRNIEIIDAVNDVICFYKQNHLYDKYKNELEYLVYYNELLTSVDRVNLINPESSIQNELLNYFLDNFPNYHQNKYFKSNPIKYKLLNSLILSKKWKTLNYVLRLNNYISKKKI